MSERPTVEEIARRAVDRTWGFVGQSRSEAERLALGVIRPAIEERDKRIAELEAENERQVVRATYLANRVREQHIQDHAAPLAEALRLIAGVEQGVGVHRPCCARGSSIARAALSSYDAYTQGQTAQRSE